MEESGLFRSTVAHVLWLLFELGKTALSNTSRRTLTGIRRTVQHRGHHYAVSARRRPHDTTDDVNCLDYDVPVANINGSERRHLDVVDQRRVVSSRSVTVLADSAPAVSSPQLAATSWRRTRYRTDVTPTSSLGENNSSDDTGSSRIAERR